MFVGVAMEEGRLDGRHEVEDDHAFVEWGVGLLGNLCCLGDLEESGGQAGGGVGGVEIRGVPPVDGGSDVGERRGGGRGVDQRVVLTREDAHVTGGRVLDGCENVFGVTLAVDDADNGN